MSCCGQKRSAMTRASQQATGRPMRGAAPARVEANAAPLPAAVAVEYIGHERARVRGNATGRVYEFSVQRRVMHLHPGDALILLRSASFRRA